MYTFNLFKDVQLTNLTSITDKREQGEVILQCSISGLHRNETDIEIRFNDETQYLCEHWPNNRQQSNGDKPYAIFTNINESTCELHIPKATSSHTGKYYCRAKIHTDKQKDCLYLKSQTIELVIPKTQPKISHRELAIIVGVSTILVCQTIVFIISCLGIRHHYKKRAQPQAAPPPPAQDNPQGAIDNHNPAGAPNQNQDPQGARIDAPPQQAPDNHGQNPHDNHNPEEIPEHGQNERQQLIGPGGKNYIVYLLAICYIIL